VTVDRRTVLKAALAAVATAAVGESAAGCDTKSRSPAGTPTADPASDASASPLESESLKSQRPSASAAGPSSASAPTATTSTAAPPSATAPAPKANGGPATEIVHGPASATGVALTFHGAGDPVLANQLLGLIEAAGGQVTVLAVGSWLDQHPEMAKRILAGGHELGNHTYHHLTMPNLRAATDDTEIAGCAKVLRTLTGSQGRWFRPSGTTRATPTILAAAGRAGYAECLSFDVDPQDYTDPGAASIVSRLLAGVRGGSIVSLHLGHAGTVQAMPAILDGLRSRGLPVISMSPLMAS
jgi:peptidoglycan/xylan/chitin deacetylase (PgdA/CDA1 family)